MFKLTKKKIIIIISLIIFIGLFICILFIKKTNGKEIVIKQNNKEIVPEWTYLGSPKLSDGSFFTVKSDSNGNKPNITSNVINNIDITINFPYIYINNKSIVYSPKNLNPANNFKYNPNWSSDLMKGIDENNKFFGYQIEFYNYDTKTIRTYYVTEIDYKTNTVTFNAPIDFTLNGSEAWPFDIWFSTKIPPPKLLNLPADALAIAMATDTTKSA
jgi:hypothetical protein